MALPPNLLPLEPLVGVWRGTGRGHYPTIADFSYVDEWEFLDIGKPFLWFVERTRHPETGAPMHTETGYLRMPEPGVVELVAAIPTGQAELGVGTAGVRDGVLEVTTVAEVRNAPAAKQVDGIRRRFLVTGDRLDYTLSMAAVGHDDTGHLEALLHRA